MPQVLDDPDSVFQLLHPLGRGSYGAVYKARIVQSGEIVAVKIIPLAADDDIDSIQKEIAILRDCKHPNVVKYYVSEHMQWWPGWYPTTTMSEDLLSAWARRPSCRAASGRRTRSGSSWNTARGVPSATSCM